MKIFLNGAEREFSMPLTVQELLDRFGVRAETTAVELNRRIIRRGDYAGTRLKDRDRVELVTMMGGG